MKTTLRKYLLIPILGLMVIGLPACNDNDEPSDKTTQRIPTKSEYRNEIAGDMWLVCEVHYINYQGIVMSYDAGTGGFLEAMYICEDGFVGFYDSSMLSIFKKTEYDAASGVAKIEVQGEERVCYQIVNWNNDWLLLDFPMYYDKTTGFEPTATRITLRRERHPDMSLWIEKYLPAGYDPSDFGWNK